MAILLLLSAMWGASFLYYRIAVPHVGPIVLAEGRTLLGAVTLAPFLRPAHWQAIRRHWKLLTVLGFLNGALPYALIAYAQLTLTAPVASILNASTAMFTAVAAYFALAEPMSPKRVVGLVIGIFGVGVVVGFSGYSGTRKFWLAVAAMVISSVAYSAAAVLSRKAKNETPLVLAFGQLFFGSVLLSPLTIAKLPQANFPLEATLSILALGVFSTAIAYLLYFKLITEAGTTNTLSVTLIVPVFGTLWSWLFRGESITPGGLVGALIIAVGVILVTGIQLPGLRRAANAA